MALCDFSIEFSMALQLVSALTYLKSKLICHNIKSPQSDQIMRMRNTALAKSTRIKAYSSLLFHVSNFGLVWKGCCIPERLREKLLKNLFAITSWCHYLSQ